jgi:hypothetical protein
MSVWRDVALCVVAFVLQVAILVPAAPAAQRAALVIGNARYASLDPLDNPVNDMRLVAGALRAAGFDVTEAADLGRDALLGAIQSFGRQLQAAGPDTVGLFYYAGHGFQVDGANYFLPVDAQLSSVTEQDIAAAELEQVVGLDWLLAQLRFAGNRLNFVILDACRNALRTRSLPFGARGLAEVDAPTGTLIAYATAPGDVAIDGQDGNSPYSKALAEALREPGLVAEALFRSVRTRVMTATQGEQVPWESSSLTGAFYFLAPPADGPPAASQDAELTLWNEVKDRGEAGLLEDYLARYPDGTFAKLARQRLDALAQPQVAAVTPRSSEIRPVDQVLYAQSDANLREQPSAEAPRIATLAAGTEIQVTGQVQGLDWLRVQLADGPSAFVWAPLLGPAPPPAPAPVEVAALPAAAADLAGRWQGEYRCQQDLVGFTLDIAAAGGDQLAAVFEFFALPGTPSFPRGSFEMAGSYDAAAGRLALRGERWREQPLGFQQHDLDGMVAPGGGAISGQILTTGCADFVLHRQ